jgi:hypothetical protein
MPEISDDVVLLTEADATPETRYQRTLLGLAGAVSLTMANTGRFPGPLAAATRMPLSVITDIRTGMTLGVTLGAVCTLADALGCELEVRLVQKAAGPAR